MGSSPHLEWEMLRKARDNSSMIQDALLIAENVYLLTARDGAMLDVRGTNIFALADNRMAQSRRSGGGAYGAEVR